MISKRLYPHFSDSVTHYEFGYIENPVKVQSYQDIITNIEGNPVIWQLPENVSTEEYVHPVYGTLTYRVVEIPRSDLNLTWNVLIARSGLDEDVESYLSISYWPVPVTSTDNFNTLRVAYHSSYKVEPGADITSVELDYIKHVVDEGLRQSSDYQTWTSHSNMNFVDSSAEFSKTVWTYSNSPVTPYHDNTASDRCVTGFEGENNISSTFAQSGTSTFGYQCIPKHVTNPNCKLMSTRAGAEFYDPDSCTFIGPKLTFSAPELSSTDRSRKYEVYRYWNNVTVFYFPDDYEAKVSVNNPKSSYPYEREWCEPWTVGSELDQGVDFKILIPSYFDIIPFAFLHSTGEWRIIHVLGLSTSRNDMWDSAYRYGELGRDTSEAIFVNHGTSAVPTSRFFNDIRYLYPYMYNEVRGYLGDNKNVISRYFYAQLYTSFQTLIQALRLKVYKNSIFKIRDCGIVAGNTFIPYSQDLIMENFKSQKSTVNVFEFDSDVEVDNLIAYNDNKFISLYSGNTLDVSTYSNVQMRHGVVVGYDGSEFVQLQ